MMRDAIGHCFDENWLATALKSHCSCLLCGLSDGPDVISIHSNCVNAVANSSACNAISSVLVKGGCGDGKSVVTANEKNGT